MEESQLNSILYLANFREAEIVSQYGKNVDLRNFMLKEGTSKRQQRPLTGLVYQSNIPSNFIILKKCKGYAHDARMRCKMCMDGGDTSKC